MPYIAGLHVDLSNSPISHDKGVESIVWLTTFIGLARSVSGQRRTAKIAREAGGEVKMPPLSLAERLVTPVHGFASFAPPLAYLVGTAMNGMEQPEWFRRWALPDEGLGIGAKAAIRTIACAACAGGFYLIDKTLEHLGSQWHYLGVREKAKVVDTGPYSVIRHPGYTAVLITEASYALMFWNYIPLVGLAVTAAMFAVKIPIEERIRENDPSAGPEYSEYKRRVTSRIIPGIW